MGGDEQKRRRKVCSVCGRKTRRDDDGGRVERRFRVCMICRGSYAFPVEQIAKYGLRFRFVHKREIPSPQTLSHIATYRQFRRVYAVLLIAKERREKKLKQEVNWMVDEMTTKILRLPDRLAAIVRETYDVLGDDFRLSDDIAIKKIRDLIEEIDPEIIHNSRKKKRLS